ncbi:MAG: hypothetical protein WBC78_03330 [Candidatus Sulfotelmatobacter sp.]
MQIEIGMAIGIPATILAGYAMAAKLFGVKPYASDILLVTTIVLSRQLWPRPFCLPARPRP